MQWNAKMIAVVGVVAAGISGVVGWRIGTTQVLQDAVSVKRQIRETTDEYEYIHPLLVCDISRDAQSVAYEELTEQFTAYIAEAKNDGRARDVGLYYRNMEEAKWTGVNADAYFTPASLLKVANMIALLREEDTGRETLGKTVTIDPSEIPTIEQGIAPMQSVEDGKTYTVEELIHYMVVYSDNRANAALGLVADLVVLNNILKDFTIQPGVNTDGGFTISPRDYSLFFRGLYNATYLSRAMSEKALEYLTVVAYTDGLRAGVPVDIPVAHKFGNYTTTVDGNVVQELHDCGIVYSPAFDYVLCVMTRGDDVAGLASVIAGLSSIAYEDAKQHVQ